MHYLRPYVHASSEVVHGAWGVASLLVGLIAMLPGGALYAFSLFSPALHDTFLLSANELNLVGAFGQVGAAASSFAAGVLSDAAGPVIPLCASSVLMFLGYFLLSLILNKTIPYNLVGMLLSYGCVGVGCQLTTIAILSANLKNFRGSWRGRILGAMGLSVGVSAAFYGIIFRIGFARSPAASFLLFLAVINAVLNVVGALVVSSPRERTSTLSWKKMVWRPTAVGGGSGAENRVPLVDPTSPSGDQVIVASWEPKKLFRNVKFWLLFVMGFFGTSQGMLFLSVMLGSLHTSHQGTPGGQAIAVIVGTVASAVGRLSVGVLSDATLHIMKRSMWAFPMYGLMLIGFTLCLLVGSPDIVVASAALVGLGYGGLAGGVLPTLTADVFGAQHYAKNYSILQPAFPLGFLVWGQCAGSIYQRATAGGNGPCIGLHCHFFVLIMMSCLVAVATGAATWLSVLLPPASAHVIKRSIAEELVEVVEGSVPLSSSLETVAKNDE